MFEVAKIEHLDITYSIDETIGGPHPKCTACHKTLLKEDEHIVLRRDQVNTQGIREGIFFCGLCANEMANGIKSLLGE